MNTARMEIRAMVPEDWPSVRAIYEEGIATGDATFQLEAPSWEAWESERQGFWTLQAGIFPENGASLSVHQRCGFRVVGRREQLGQRNGRWRDVLLLERRSPCVGV